MPATSSKPPRRAPRVLAAALACLGLAACADYRARSDSITFELGNAVAHNIAVQTIDPWPRRAANTRIDVDGERLRIAAERYKANKSIPPRGLTTQGVIHIGPAAGATP